MEPMQTEEIKQPPKELTATDLRDYYEVFFPYKPFIDWLTYFEKVTVKFTNEVKLDVRESFAKRELSFTLQNDIYCRFQCYNNEDELKKALTDKTPVKIDIGAIYNYPPSCRTHIDEKNKFEPVEKEIVFDIDLTDYDDVRRCCKGTKVCKKCWKFLSCAAKILDEILRKELGYKNLLWVFSGRRGMHCWLCDNRVRRLRPQVRLEIVQFIAEKFEKNENDHKVIAIKSYKYPTIKNSIKVVQHYFEIAMAEQDYFADPAHAMRLFNFITDEQIKSKVIYSISKHISSIDKWKEMCNHIDEITKYKIMFTYMYPRLDINVSKGLNHLLKSPFCIHPSTGNICVPLTMQLLEKFDPAGVPTIFTLLRQYQEQLKLCTTDDMKKELLAHVWERTDAMIYYRVFEQFLAQLKLDVSKKDKL